MPCVSCRCLHAQAAHVIYRYTHLRAIALILIAQVRSLCLLWWPGLLQKKPHVALARETTEGLTLLYWQQRGKKALAPKPP